MILIKVMSPVIFMVALTMLIVFLALGVSLLMANWEVVLVLFIFAIIYCWDRQQKAEK